MGSVSSGVSLKTIPQQITLSEQCFYKKSDAHTDFDYIQPNIPSLSYPLIGL